MYLCVLLIYFYSPSLFSVGQVKFSCVCLKDVSLFLFCLPLGPFPETSNICFYNFHQWVNSHQKAGQQISSCCHARVSSPILVNCLYRKFTWCKDIQHAVILSIHYVPLQVSWTLVQCTNWEVVPTLGMTSSQFLAVLSTSFLGQLRD